MFKLIKYMVKNYKDIFTALILALFVWGYHSYQESTEIVLNVPIDYSQIIKNTTELTHKVDYITLTIRTPKNNLNNIRSEKIDIKYKKLNIEKNPYGKYYILLPKSAINIPDRSVLISYNPEKIIFSFKNDVN